MKIEVNDRTVSQIIGLIPKDNLIKYLKEVLKNEERKYRSTSVLEYLLGSKSFKTAADFPIDEEMAKKIAKNTWGENCKPETIQTIDVINVEDLIIFKYKDLAGIERRDSITIDWYEDNKS